MPRFAAALLVLVSLSLPLAGQANSDWLRQPYQVEIYLCATPHPHLTPEYLAMVQREVRDTLQRDLGRAGVVTARAGTTREAQKLHPLMAEVVLEGWEALDKPSYALTGKKICLVRLTFEDDEYLLEGRQVDGDTGLVTPLRRRQTGNRRWVSRAAALLIGQDLGQTAAINEITGQTVSFQLRAAGLGEPESIKLRTGEIFAIARVTQGAEGELLGRREEFAYLFVTGINAETGRCLGRLSTRYPDSMRKDRATVAFRAMKLGTMRAQLAVRVVDDKSGAPVAGCEVLLFPGGFPHKADSQARPPLKLGATDSAGRIQSPDPIDHIVFARFQLGPMGVNVPIVLFDDQLVTVRLSNVESADRLAEFNVAYKRWDQERVQVGNHIETEWESIRALLAEKKDKEAVERMEKLLAKVQADVAELRESFKPVKEMSAAVANFAGPKVKQGEEGLKSLDALGESVAKMIKEMKDPSEATKARNQGQLALENQKFDEAIRFFEQSLKLEPNQPQVQRRLERLKKMWNIPRSNTAHRQAREYFLKTWPDLAWRDRREKLEECERQMEVLRANGDSLTAQILLKTNLDVIRKLGEMLTAAKEANKEEDQARIADMEDLLSRLLELNGDLADFIRNTGL
jgi:tetratricopeptide (TPR) repeat protein